jgi:hypothetical protein
MGEHIKNENAFGSVVGPHDQPVVTRELKTVLVPTISA